MGQVLFTNASLLDPNRDELQVGVSVLVEGDTWDLVKGSSPNRRYAGWSCIAWVD